MPDRWAVAAGNWSNTATWDGGTLPGSGDDVFADGFAVTIDQDITVLSIRTTQRSGGTAGGSFTTSGTRTVNADSHAGTTTCLTLTASSNSIQNGNSFGSLTTNSRFGTQVNVTCTQNGNSTGGNGTSRIGTVLTGGTQNGNATGGTAANAQGSSLGSSAILNGNAIGGSANTATGAAIGAGSIHNGNSFAGTVSGAHGSSLTNGGIQNGNATGGSVSGAHGTSVSAGIFNGNATGGSVSGSYGVSLASTGGTAFVPTATGNTAGAFGIYADLATVRHIVIIQNEVGIAPKSLTAFTETTSTNVPFVSFEGGGGSSLPLIGPGGLVY